MVVVFFDSVVVLGAAVEVADATLRTAVVDVVVVGFGLAGAGAATAAGFGAVEVAEVVVVGLRIGAGFC